MIEPDMGVTLKDKLRDPDEAFAGRLRALALFIPLGLGLLVTLVFAALVIISRNVTDPGQVKTLDLWSGMLSGAIIPIIFVPYAILKTLHIYVSVKLRKKEREAV